MSKDDEISRPDDQSNPEAVRHIMATLFSAQNALRSLAPAYKWAGLGNFHGDYGEFVACAHYGLCKSAAGSNGHAMTVDGKSVQIKANHAASQIGFRREADLMLVIKVSTDGSWQEIYYGPFTPIKAASRYSARDNKSMIAAQKLKAISAACVQVS